MLRTEVSQARFARHPGARSANAVRKACLFQTFGTAPWKNLLKALSSEFVLVTQAVGCESGEFLPMSVVAATLRRSCLLAAAAVSSWAGAGELLEPHPSRNDNYGESFTFVADLEDGTYVWTQFSVTHLGPGSDHAACRAVVVAPGRKAWAPGERYSKKDWWYDRNNQTLKIGTCTAKEGDTVEVKAHFPKGKVELTFGAALQRLTPPGTTINQGDSRYRASILLRNAPVEAKLALPGAAPKTLKGGGFVDHSHSTWQPTKLAKQWVRFRALKQAPHSVLVGRESKEGTFGPLYLVEDDGAPKTYESFEAQRIGEGEKPNWSVTIKGKSGSLKLRSKTLLFRSAPVQDLGVLGTLVRPVVGSPVTYTYRAVLEGDGAPVEGLMEVSLDGG